MINKEKTNILVVCMGNICRSPTGEAVLRKKALQLGVDVNVDSAGTVGSHKGSKPDPRAVSAGERRGYSFKGIRARQVTRADFDKFDFILAADEYNLRDLQEQCPDEHLHKIQLFLSYSDEDFDEIPDPYYGGERGFELVLDLIEDASENLLKNL